MSQLTVWISQNYKTFSLWLVTIFVGCIISYFINKHFNQQTASEQCEILAADPEDFHNKPGTMGKPLIYIDLNAQEYCSQAVQPGYTTKVKASDFYRLGRVYHSKAKELHSNQNSKKRSYYLNALHAYENALKIEPDYALAKCNAAIVMLRLNNCHDFKYDTKEIQNLFSNSSKSCVNTPIYSKPEEKNKACQNDMPVPQ